MHYQRTRAIRVGALVAGCAAVFLGLVVFVIGASFSSNRVDYAIRFEDNVKGMVVGSKVNYQGVPTGVVSDIRFIGGATHVTLSIDPTKATIYDVTRARLDRLLVTGQVTVELEGWSADARPLSVGSRIEPVKDPMHNLTRTLPEVIDQAAQVLTSANRSLQRVEALLGGDNAGRVAAILANLERATDEVPVAALDALGAMHSTLSAAREAVDTIDYAAANYGHLAAHNGDIRAVLADSRAALETLKGLGGRVHSAADEVHGLLAAMRTPVLTTLERVRESFREVQGVAQMLRMAPEVLLFGRDRPAGQPTGWPASPTK